MTLYKINIELNWLITAKLMGSTHLVNTSFVPVKDPPNGLHTLAKFTTDNGLCMGLGTLSSH